MFVGIIFRDFNIHVVGSSRTKRIPIASFGTVFDNPRTQTTDARRYVDDEAPIRRLMRINLEDRYTIVVTGDPELALEAALRSKPNAILLDLRMPNYSGFELCRTFKSIACTQMIPIIIVTGEAGADTKSYCQELGAAAYFEKPIDFDALRTGLEKVLQAAHPERRGEVRVNLRAMLNLRGTDRQRKPFEEMCDTENVGKSTCSCSCTALLDKRSKVSVSMVTGGKRFLGMARITRSDDGNPIRFRYAFRFVRQDVNWILQ
jgi:DNA-binding response OmpR family regulator